MLADRERKQHGRCIGYGAIQLPNGGFEHKESDMSHRRLSLCIVVVLLFVLTSPALAGGWSVTTLDELPDVIVVDDPVTIGFVVRQHGVHIVEGLEPVITAVHADSHEQLEVTAEEDSPGHYQVELVFPAEGVWDWSVSAFGPEQPLPPLTVLSDRATSTKEESASEALSGEEALIERGAALFVGKGCVVCHQHSAIEVAPWASINAGPSLSGFTADVDYLSAWLADPSAVRDNAIMPDLDLSDEEIEALVAFLNAEERSPSVAKSSTDR